MYVNEYRQRKKKAVRELTIAILFGVGVLSVGLCVRDQSEQQKTYQETTVNETYIYK